ncbi:MAG: DNA polymerase III subunit gamma/tau [Oscillospiraceae bacterium]|nr:DNA polymerase III subunit gamma/tau [Oscillospiraceae bacterium]
MYLALYRKYRPLTFADVISQPTITKTLTNQIINSQMAHAYLFTGSRGTGKTTCAKILAKAVNCESPVNGNPCLVCGACVAIDEGVSDIAEIDAASNNGVGDVRLLREELNYLPVSCKYRVYIIDEAHMLSSGAFNALLKTIEEPPPHVIFILATTENHKIPATILSRCQRFDFRRIDIRESADRLIEIAQKEGVMLEPSAALLISRLSEGGMRDALSLLDTALSKSPNVTTELVRESAGIVGSAHLFSISKAAHEQNCTKAIEILTELWGLSKDLTRLIDELIYHYRNLMLLKAGVVSDGLLSCLPEEIPEYKELSERLTLDEIMRCMKTLESGFERLGRSKNAKITAEMTIIKLCQPEQVDDNIKQESTRTHSQLGRVVNYISQESPPNPAISGGGGAYDNFFKEITSTPVSTVASTMGMGKKPTQRTLEPVMRSNVESFESVEEEKPTHYQPGNILSGLPSYLQAMLSDVRAEIEGDNLYLYGGELSKSVVENPESKKAIAETAQKHTGSALNVIFKVVGEGFESEPEQPEIPKSRIEIFLDIARAQGVKVKVK